MVRFDNTFQRTNAEAKNPYTLSGLWMHSSEIEDIQFNTAQLAVLNRTYLNEFTDWVDFGGRSPDFLQMSEFNMGPQYWKFHLSH